MNNSMENIFCFVAITFDLIVLSGKRKTVVKSPDLLHRCKNQF